MVYPMNDWLLKRITEEKIQRALREAEVDRLLSEINPRRKNWLSRLACHLFGSPAVRCQPQSHRRVASAAMTAES
jgi:hypothetical protein